jgi:hypothetical protein
MVSAPSTEYGFRVRSRRGWNMTPLIPELAREDVRGVFDGERSRSVKGFRTFRSSRPGYSIAAVTFRSRSQSSTSSRWMVSHRQACRMRSGANCSTFSTSARLVLGRAVGLDDGSALFAAVCEQGLDGVVARRRDSLYRSGERGWVKVKNRSYSPQERGCWGLGPDVVQPDRRRGDHRIDGPRRGGAPATAPPAR